MQSLKKLFGLVIFFPIAIAQAAAEQATIATASNFSRTMSELIAAFEQRHPHRIVQVNAASGVLFNQIAYGAPFQAFLSADARYPQALLQRGLVTEAQAFTYAIGQLAVASRSLPSEQLELKALIAALVNQQQKLAIANPNTAPYGIAARETLLSLKLWRQAKPHLVRGNNIGQSFQFVASGNAQAGIVALSQVIGSDMAFRPIPQQHHRPIRQQAILLQSKNTAAVAFLDFLQTADAKKIIQRHGYLTEK